MPTCNKCLAALPESSFAVKKLSGYRHPTCKKCEYAAKKVAGSTPRGRAQRMWDGICSRAGNRSGAYPTYSDVEVRMSREQFISWATPVLTQWYGRYPDVVPTIDRIDCNGHYEIKNLRLLSMRQNVIARGSNKNVLAPEGMAWCFICSRYLATGLFYKNVRNSNGLSANCKRCHSEKYSGVKKPHPTEQEVDAVIARYTSGESITKISRDCGRSKSWIYTALAKRNIRSAQPAAGQQ